MREPLTSAQLRTLTVGDRVSRLVGPGIVETAPVTSTTATQIVVRWPAGGIARYLRETGRRAGCPGEVLRQAEPFEGEFPPRHCSQCDADNVDICCTGAIYDDGSADEFASCRACCGPHVRFDPQVIYYPIG